MSTDSDQEKRPPLEGLVVADFSRVLAGPLAAMILGDLGADVIKVARPGLGDETRLGVRRGWVANPRTRWE